MQFLLVDTATLTPADVVAGYDVWPAVDLGGPHAAGALVHIDIASMVLAAMDVSALPPAARFAGEEASLEILIDTSPDSIFPWHQIGRSFRFVAQFDGLSEEVTITSCSAIVHDDGVRAPDFNTPAVLQWLRARTKVTGTVAFSVAATLL